MEETNIVFQCIAGNGKILVFSISIISNLISATPEPLGTIGNTLFSFPTINFQKV